MGKFIRIYVWQLISILFNFASIFVVTPFISSNQSIYGIYSIVISAYLFIAYADFGFLGAAMKYAAESFAQKNMVDEIKVIGFATMIFLSFVILYSVGIFVISVYPSILVNSIKEDEVGIARSLLIILGTFCPVFVFQRILQIIFGIRLQDYKFQKILIISNLIKISSAFLFFANGKYMIVEYFLFSQLCTLSAVIIGFYIIQKKLKYDLKFLFKSIRFSKDQYLKTKKLAYTSLFLTLSWILYYELDIFVISKFIGPTAVAIFAIALTIMTYFRTIFGVLFSPFIAKFNHFMGVKDFEGLKHFFFKVLIVFIPVTIFPVITIIFTAKNFIYTWVGDSYSSSIPITQIMLMCYLFSFISYPTGILLMANERVKALYVTSAVQPIIYWLGIISTYTIFKLEAFAYFKFIAFFIEAIIYLIYIFFIFKIQLWSFIKQIILPIFPGVILILISLKFGQTYFPIEHNKISLLYYFIGVAIVVGIGLMSYYFSSKVYRNFVNSFFLRILGRNQNTVTNV